MCHQASSGRIQAAAAGLNLPASWTEALDETAELEHETAQEKRVGLVAMQVSAAPSWGPHMGASRPPVRLRHRQRHPRKRRSVRLALAQVPDGEGSR